MEVYTMVIQIPKFVKDDVKDELERLYKTGRKDDQYKAIRYFFEKVIFEPNQKVNSLRVAYAYEYITEITKVLKDEYDIERIDNRLEELYAAGAFVTPRHAKVKLKVDANAHQGETLRKTKRDKYTDKHHNVVATKVNSTVQINISPSPTGDINKSKSNTK